MNWAAAAEKGPKSVEVHKVPRLEVLQTPLISESSPQPDRHWEQLEAGGWIQHFPPIRILKIHLQLTSRSRPCRPMTHRAMRPALSAPEPRHQLLKPRTTFGEWALPRANAWKYFRCSEVSVASMSAERAIAQCHANCRTCDGSAVLRPRLSLEPKRSLNACLQKQDRKGHSC